MHTWLLGGVLVVGIGLSMPGGVAAQLPPRAAVYMDTLASFQGESAPVRVIFYEIRFHKGLGEGSGVGVIVLEPNGTEIARAWDDQAGLGLSEGTGVYDVTGDGWPEVILIGWAGAKTFSATVYQFQKRKLEQIFHIDGFRVKVVHLRGQPVIVCGSWGGLSDLYSWKDGEFVDANDQFPEFFAPEIEEQRRILESPQGAPAYVIADACFLGARALVYGKEYDQAQELCLRALHVARNAPASFPAEVGASPEKRDEERKQAEARIKTVLEQISRARKEKLSRLPK